MAGLAAGGGRRHLPRMGLAVVGPAGGPSPDPGGAALRPQLRHRGLRGAATLDPHPAAAAAARCADDVALQPAGGVGGGPATAGPDRPAGPVASHRHVASPFPGRGTADHYEHRRRRHPGRPAGGRAAAVRRRPDRRPATGGPAGSARSPGDRRRAGSHSGAADLPGDGGGVVPQPRQAGPGRVRRRSATRGRHAQPYQPPASPPGSAPAAGQPPVGGGYSYQVPAPAQPGEAAAPSLRSDDWRTAADAGWQAAAAAAKPTSGGATKSGLPKRVPQAQLVPGSVDTRPPSAAQRRSPDEIRGLLSAYHRGVQRGRASGGHPQ